MESTTVTLYFDSESNGIRVSTKNDTEFDRNVYVYNLDNNGLSEAFITMDDFVNNVIRLNLVPQVNSVDEKCDIGYINVLENKTQSMSVNDSIHIVNSSEKMEMHKTNDSLENNLLFETIVISVDNNTDLITAGIRVSTKNDTEFDRDVYVYNLDNNGLSEAFITMDDFVNNVIHLNLAPQVNTVDEKCDIDIDYINVFANKTQSMSVNDSIHIDNSGEIMEMHKSNDSLENNLLLENIVISVDNNTGLITAENIGVQTVKREELVETNITTSYMRGRRSKNVVENMTPHEIQEIIKEWDIESICKLRDTRQIERESGVKCEFLIFTCPFCEHTSKVRSQLRKHIITHLRMEDRPIGCTLCPKRFITKSALKEHMNSHTGEKPLKCDICNFATRYKLHLLAHLQKHTENDNLVTPFVCPICQKKFTTEKTLEHHQRFHKSEFLYECHECGSTFPNKMVLSSHLRSHDPLDTDKDKKTKTAKKVDKDKRTKTAKKVDKDKRTTNKVDKDKKTETAKKGKTGMVNGEFKCPECPFTTSHLRIMRLHESQHPDLPKYKCDYCDFRGKARRNLQTHKRVHLKECDRPFKCDQCPAGFIDKRCMLAHMYRHTGEKSFTCDICDFKATCQHYINDHKRRMHEERPHKCAICQAGFYNPKYLRSHLLHKHGDPE